MITRTYSIDYTASGDTIGSPSTSNGAIAKLDAEDDLIYNYLNLIQQSYYGATEPNSPVAGQLWFDSVNVVLKQYDGSSWSAVASSSGISNLVEDTSPQLGGFLDLNQFYVSLNPSPTSNLGFNGIGETATAGDNLVIGDVCYLNADGTYHKAVATAVGTTAGILRMATATIASAATGVFLKDGYIRYDTWAWGTKGAELYVGTSGGSPTSTRPSTTGQFVRIVGHALTSHILEFHPSETYIQLP